VEVSVRLSFRSRKWGGDDEMRAEPATFEEKGIHFYTRTRGGVREERGPVERLRDRDSDRFRESVAGSGMR